MKRVLIAMLMQAYCTAYSQVDSVRKYKNEVSVYTDVFANGFGAQYAHWGHPRHFLSIGADINAVGIPKSSATQYHSINDSVLKISNNTYLTTSVGVSIGAGYLVKRSNPAITLSAGILAGSVCRHTWFWATESPLNPKTDTNSLFVGTGITEEPRIKGFYTGVFGSATVLADITHSLKFYSTVTLDFCYLYFNRRIHPSELAFKEVLSVGLRYYF